MDHSCRNLATCLLAVAAALTCGCLPRGPFPPATLFGEREHPNCDGGGSCATCRRGSHRDQSGPDASDAGPPPPLMAPISNFHPVPTRPVFTPWDVGNPAPEQISGPLAWRQGITRPAADEPADKPPAIEKPSSTPVARRTLPVPANLPDEKPVSPSGDRSDADANGNQPNPGWHSPGQRF